MTAVRFIATALGLAVSVGASAAELDDVGAASDAAGAADSSAVDAAGANGSAADETDAADGSPRQVIVRRAFVPSDTDRHGEVRLLRRGDAVVVQTLLESRVLRRVIAEIALKEQTNWPAGAEHHGDSQAYVAALAATAREVAHRHARRDQRRKHDQKLLVELVLAPDRSSIVVFELPVGELRDRQTLTERERVRTLEPARAYVERNMVLIMEDAFGMHRAEARRVLAGAGSSETDQSNSPDP